MREELETLDLNSWQKKVPGSTQKRAIEALENGKVIFLPELSFHLDQKELQLLSPDKVDPKSKNISYDTRSGKVGGCRCIGEELELMRMMVKRFADSSKSLLEMLLPQYVADANQARTSFRPVEASGRKLSYRKDDTLLHVDSFPANPVKGKRILRIFSNVNPNGKPRVWRLGEPFPTVVERFGRKLTPPMLGSAAFMKLFGITKDYRTLYDHYMLQLHNTMKGDKDYQNTVQYTEVKFPPGSTWIVYTDQVSHAAMSGQYLFEQTFYLPVSAMENPAKTPLKVLEKYFDKTLL